MLEPFDDVAAFEQSEIPATDLEISYVGAEPKDFQVRSALFRTNISPDDDEAAHAGKWNGLFFRGVCFYKGDEAVRVA